jgi:hypothetical protein
MADKSQHGNTLLQTTTSKQPYPATIGGRQALIFSGEQSLDSIGSSGFTNGSAALSIYAVAAWTGGTYSNWLTLFGYGGTALYTEATLNGISGPLIAIGNDGAAADFITTTAWPATPELLTANFASTTEALAINGGALASLAASMTTPAGSAVSLGNSVLGRNGSEYWIGPVYEVLMFNAILSTAEQQFVEGYLACKWGLTLASTHPYAGNCPATAIAHLTLSLAVVALGNQGPGTDLTYTTTFTNGSGTLVYDPVINVAVPAGTQYKFGSATQSLGSTGLSLGSGATATFSNDGGTTHAYVPTDGGGGAATGYDPNVTNIQWKLSGALGTASTVNLGSTSYTVSIK